MNPSASTASLRIDLPPRQVPPPLQRLVKVLQSFGVVLLLMGGILLIADHEWGQLWIRLLLLVFGAIPVVAGCLSNCSACRPRRAARAWAQG